ncbi:glycosyltransferase family 2 protein [Flavobacterium sp. N2038]|uniref:glycosyltransferase family 2 protein n=1 Tax=Flavobacterium sp. N2038 TaxID=2986829 RepID=UPI0022251B66|nr:glycosyltransferase family 2 protein [Flavobacterium sp. N2038]
MISKNITIAICTYNRPLLLKKCIESVLIQNTDCEYEVIVIDNDARKTAQEVVEKYKPKVQYYFQPLKGLSYARNMAVSNANGEFLLFIDDDEYADRDWLNNMINCQKKYSADVVLGKVIYEIPDHFPSYIKNSLFFFRKNRITGENAGVNEGYTGNTLVHKKLFNLRTPAFLEEFNNTGGEDSDFFNFLLSKKAKIIFSSEAVIYETQDVKRLKISWFYKRGYRSGYNYSSHLLRTNHFFIGYIKLLFSAFGGLVLSFLLLFRTVFSPDKYFIKMLAKLGNQLGKIGYMCHFQIKDY